MFATLLQESTRYPKQVLRQYVANFRPCPFLDQTINPPKRVGMVVRAWLEQGGGRVLGEVVLDEGAEELYHLTIRGKVLCGAEYPQMLTTDVVGKVTCVQCLEA